jgi:MoaA/NifB/PqqE/SkfB family radical SAM enzyme
MRAIFVGFACNNACVFCAQGGMRGTEEAAEGVDAQIAAIVAGETVAFTGGEPTLHDELPAWIRAAAARTPARILLQTNGRRLAYLAYARALRDASAALSLDVSLHGSTAPMHDYHTGVRGSFAQTLLGLRHARALGLATGVTAVVTRSSFRHLTDLVRLAHASGAVAVHLAHAAPFGTAARDADRVIPAPEMVAPHLAAAVAEASSLGLRVVTNDALEDGSFAGIGRVEEPAPAAPAAGSPRRLPLAALGRPSPAVREVHATTRRTGSDLAVLFPTLFTRGPG